MKNSKKNNYHGKNRKEHKNNSASNFHTKDTNNSKKFNRSSINSF